MKQLFKYLFLLPTLFMATQVVSADEGWSFDENTGILYIDKDFDGVYADDYPWHSVCSEVKNVSIGSGVTKIGVEMFTGCINLKEIGIPNGVTTINEFAFRDCSSLRAITIPASMADIRYNAFVGCSVLSNVIVNSENARYRDLEGRALVAGDTLVLGCTSGYIPKGVTVIGNMAFFGRVLENSTLVIPEGVTSIERYAFVQCKVNSIHLPKTLQKCAYYSFGYLNFANYIKEIHIDDLSDWFDIDFDENSNPLETGADFYVNGELMNETITTPEGLTVIKAEVLSGWKGHELIISEGVKTISNWAFFNIKNLSTITIPSSVTSIGTQAFMECGNPQNVYCYAESVPTTKENAFEDTNIANATLHVPANVLEDYRNTVPWSGFGKFANIKTAEPSVASGEYYLYHAESKRFLARGEHWGACATVDRYGIPFVWTAEEYSLKFLDSNVDLFETDDSNIYTDNASTGFAFEEVEGGYLLKSQKSNRYLTIVDAAITHDIVNVTNDASAAVVWQLKSKAEHDAIVAGYVEENYMNVIKAAGLTTTAGDFVDYLATLTAEDKTSAIGTARFNGSAGDWTFTEVRHQDWQPAYGADFCELWQATGSYTQTLTGLAEGIYKVTVQGFERSGWWDLCVALGEKGYEITTATLSANGEEVNLKSWLSGKTDENNPDNTGQAIAKFNEGKYMNEVYTYVGADGTLTLTVCKPSHVGGNWIVFNNFTLTRYAEGDTGIDMTTDNRQQTTVIYDLMGRKVESPAKGIYIVGGKKVVIK